MSSLLTKVSPIEYPKLFEARSVMIEAPCMEEILSDLSFASTNLSTTTHETLPLQCTTANMKLLEPAAIYTQDLIVSIPLTHVYESAEQRSDIFKEVFEILTSSEISDNIVVIEQFPSVRVIEESIDKYLEGAEVNISNNLLQTIFPPSTVSGMNYSDRLWKQENTINYFSDQKTKPKLNDRNKIRSRSITDIEGNGSPRIRYKPSFWDLVFVLLQPPLQFKKSDEIILPHNLYPYQIDGVKFLITNCHALLADDMGTGKTVMTIVALKLLMQKGSISKVLILCPPSVLLEWRKHLIEWSPELINCFVRGSRDMRKQMWDIPAHVYVTSYDTLRSDVDNSVMARNTVSGFDIVVIDEAHHIKNTTTSRARAIKKLSPRYRWALTGTPIQNKMEDLAGVFDFVYPRFLSSYDMIPERIKQKIAPHFLRRRKKDVLKDLPPKIKQDLWLEMSEDQKTAYLQIEHDVQNELEGLGSNITKQHIFAKMQKLKQICNFPPNGNSSPKLSALKDQIEDIVESGNKVIVFSQYIEEGVNKITDAFERYGVSKIVGGQTDSTRRSEIERFKLSKNVPILVASIRSGGEGLNLTEASYVVHFDHWWNPAVMWQAEDRVHRRGQTQNVNIYSYWMTDTIDERIYNVLKNKGLLFQNVIDGLAEDTIDELFTLDDLLEMVGVRKPSSKPKAFDPNKWKNLDEEEIRLRLYEISPREFEELIEELMHYLGFPNVKVTKKTGDGGIDVLSTRITENGVERIAAQCKRYKNPVGVHIAREFLGAIHDDKSIIRGLLITTGEFSSECISYCIRHNIEMISGSRVAEYVKQFGLSK